MAFLAKVAFSDPQDAFRGQAELNRSARGWTNKSPEHVGVSETVLTTRVRESNRSLHSSPHQADCFWSKNTLCGDLSENNFVSLSLLYFWLLISHRDLESDGLDLFLGVIVAVLSWQGRAPYLECAFLGKCWVVATFRV